MKLITRKQMGWPPSAAPLQATTKGVKVHYEGTPVFPIAHSKCVAHWTTIRNSHLNHPTENYSDVAYNFAVCQHGYVLEGRGLGRRTGANGNQELNRGHYAVVVFVGTHGEIEPTQGAIAALREVIQYLRDHGAGKEIKGHRDGHATSCPGEPLYALVKSGALEPGTKEPEPQEDAEVPALLTENQSGGPALEAGRWTTVAMANDTALIQGPRYVNAMAYVRLEGTPGEMVHGQFYLTNVTTKNNSGWHEEFGGVFDREGKLTASFAYVNELPKDIQLKLQIKSSASAKVVQRTIKVLHWAKS